MSSLRGLKALIHDAVDAVTVLVEEAHAAAARPVVAVGHAAGAGDAADTVEAVRGALTGTTLATVRGVNRLVQQVTDAVWDHVGPAPRTPAPVPLRSDTYKTPAGAADALIGVVNGLVGDHLEASDNGLGLGLRLRCRDRWVEPDWTAEDVGPRVVVLVHGMSATEISWCLDAERALGAADLDYGTLLERDLGLTPVYVRHNSGRSLERSGIALAEALEALCARWPVPVEELVLVGHSMGGLICRQALAHGRTLGFTWVERTSRLAALGSPHQGAPLARAAETAARLLGAVDLPGTRVAGRILEVRSRGIRDLEAGLDGMPLDPGVRHAFFAGALSRHVNPATKVVGDLLVPIRSAEGPARQREASAHTARFIGVAHHAMQTNAGIYEELRAFLAGERDAGR